MADLTAIHFIRPGTHTDSRGTRVTLSAADLVAMAEAYDPALHEAPIVVGHPADDAPAYGWVQRIVTDEDGATALAGQIDPAFAEELREGRFKKVSAAIYLPGSPSSPRPDGYYLRHIGLLGAMPPAIKGLRQTQFAGGDGYVTVYLGEVSGFNLAGLFRGLRDWMIGQFGGEAADKALPGYLIDSLRDQAAMPSPAPEASYGEAQNRRGERRDAPAGSDVPAKTAAPLFGEQGGKMPDDVAAREAELARREAELAERDRALAALTAEFEAQRRRAEAQAFLGELNAGGVRVLPGDLQALALLLSGIDDSTPDVAFGETDGRPAGRQTWLRSWLRRLPVQVDLAERSAGDGHAPNASDPESVAAAALAFQAAERAAGRAVPPIDEAVRLVFPAA